MRMWEELNLLVQRIFCAFKVVVSKLKVYWYKQHIQIAES